MSPHCLRKRSNAVWARSTGALTITRASRSPPCIRAGASGICCHISVYVDYSVLSATSQYWSLVAAILLPQLFQAVGNVTLSVVQVSSSSKCPPARWAQCTSTAKLNLRIPRLTDLGPNGSRSVSRAMERALRE